MTSIFGCGHPQKTRNASFVPRPSSVRHCNRSSLRTSRILGRFSKSVCLPFLRIDVITSLDSVTFDEAWRTRLEVEMDGLAAIVIGRDELLKNKKATGRPKDVSDADNARKAESQEEILRTLCQTIMAVAAVTFARRRVSGYGIIRMPRVILAIGSNQQSDAASRPSIRIAIHVHRLPSRSRIRWRRS